MILYESEIEQITLDILKECGYEILFGPDISEGLYKLRDYSDVVLQTRIQEAVGKINAEIPTDAQEEALKKLLRTQSVNLLVNNEIFHKMLVDGIDVKFSIGEGKSKTDKVKIIDYKNIDNNIFTAINQFTVIENNNNKRPDIVLFIYHDLN